MLGGRISQQDEDEVEDELEALQAEMAARDNPQPELPAVPQANLPVSERQTETEEPTRHEERQMLAA